MNKNIAKIWGLVSLCLVGVTITIWGLNSCDSSSCDGKKCKSAIGLKESEKPSQRDSSFNRENPKMASKFNVFVESSASMDGYVNGHTDFKTILYRLIGEVETDVLLSDSPISLNYINSEIIKKSGTYKQFTDGLSPTSFSSAKGDRAHSDIIEIISSVVSKTQKNGISMLATDCVYSPDNSDDIDKALEKQQTDMHNILKKKSKSNPKFGVLLYRLISDFHGIYYTKTDAHIQCDGKRPYFIWFFGDESLLASVSESISKIMSDNSAKVIVGIPGYNYLPYKTIGSDHSYHFLNRKTNKDSLYTFSFIADMSRLPLSAEYITNIGNYNLNKANKFSIKKIEKYSNPKNPMYNYKYTISIKGGKNSFVTPTLVEISLKSMLEKMPDWVESYDDPKGNDYNNGYTPSKLRTFGLKSLVDGISDFYDNSDYVTFKIKIN